MIRFPAFFALFAVAASSCSQEPEAPPPTPVQWTQVSDGQENGARIFSGAVAAGEQVEIGFDAGGRITAINVDTGDAFRRGQILASLDNREQRLRISEINADISRSSAQLAEASANLKRAGELVGSGAISQAEYDAALSAKRTISADIARLQATRATAQKSASDTRIYAPYAGRVVRKIASTAQAVSPNEPILEIQSTGRTREVDISIPEDLIGTLVKDMDVMVTFAALGDLQVSGKISRIGSQTTGQAAYPVTVAITGAPMSLVNGMTAEVAIPFAANKEAPSGFTIPSTAIVAGKKDTRFVFIVSEKTRIAAMRPVIITRMSSDGAVISRGIQKGDLVVTKGAAFLKNGDKVSLMGKDARRFSE